MVKEYVDTLLFIGFTCYRAPAVDITQSVLISLTKTTTKNNRQQTFFL